MVNLFSDTQTRPTPEMRAAIARAEVGDEQRRADPTVIALEERVAALLGHEAAVFLPSGTMCNEIAIRLHIRPGGDEILLGRDTPPRRCEGGAPAAVSGAVMTIVEGEASMFTADALDAAVRAHPAGDRYAPRPRLVCVEQPTNMGGGRARRGGGGGGGGGGGARASGWGGAGAPRARAGPPPPPPAPAS